MRTSGVVVRGIRAPLVREGDNLEDVVIKSLIDQSDNDGFKFNDRDVVQITESVVARSQGNYITVDQVQSEFRVKFNNSKHIGVLFPILSRNRFQLILKGLARSTSKITLVLSYPSDEVGNRLFKEELDYYGLDGTDVLNENDYNFYFHGEKHIFTGVNYVEYYKSIVESEDCEIEILFSNKIPNQVLKLNQLVVCNIHNSQKITNSILRHKNYKSSTIVVLLDDVQSISINGSGYNPDYGLLGSNKATEERLKLFPINGEQIVNSIKQKIKKLTSKEVEVMVYGDGCFKDPVSEIWEFADPVVAPFYTKGILDSIPNELKLKYLIDNNRSDKSIINQLVSKEKNLVGSMQSQGTTPRRVVDLIGSLCDLTSGSGDKGTPIVLVQGYFDNLSAE